MTLDLPNLIVGAIFGFVVGVATHWAYVAMEKYWARRKLANQYRSLAGRYANFRVKENGAYEPTGGTIKLEWQRGGSFTAEGLHNNGVMEWRSTIEMDLKGTGTGNYMSVEPGGHGTQNITYIPGTGYFDVMTAITNQPSAGPFFHQWRRTR